MTDIPNISVEIHVKTDISAKIKGIFLLKEDSSLLHYNMLFFLEAVLVKKLLKITTCIRKSLKAFLTLNASSLTSDRNLNGKIDGNARLHGSLSV